MCQNHHVNSGFSVLQLRASTWLSGYDFLQKARPLLSLIKPVEVLVQSPKKAACEASMGYASEELLSIFLAPFGIFPKLCKFGFSGASCQKSHVKFPDVVM